MNDDPAASSCAKDIDLGGGPPRALFVEPGLGTRRTGAVTPVPRHVPWLLALLVGVRSSTRRDDVRGTSCGSRPCPGARRSSSRAAISPRRARRPEGGTLGALIGFVSSAHLWGIIYYHEAVYLLILAYHAVVWGLFSAWAGVCIVRGGKHHALAAAAGWAFIETVRSSGSISFPFYFGGTLADELPVAQIVSVVGTEGLIRASILGWVLSRRTLRDAVGRAALGEAGIFLAGARHGDARNWRRSAASCHVAKSALHDPRERAPGLDTVMAILARDGGRPLSGRRRRAVRLSVSRSAGVEAPAGSGLVPGDGIRLAHPSDDGGDAPAAPVQRHPSPAEDRRHVRCELHRPPRARFRERRGHRDAGSSGAAGAQKRRDEARARAVHRGAPFAV